MPNIYDRFGTKVIKTYWTPPLQIVLEDDNDILFLQFTIGITNKLLTFNPTNVFEKRKSVIFICKFSTTI